MTLADKNQLLPHQDVAAWLKTAKLLHPNIHTELLYATELFKAGVTALWPAPFQTFLTTYAQLRDWAGISCDLLDGWIRGSLLPENPSFAAAFGKQPEPGSILSQPPVINWFMAVRVLDGALCIMMKFCVLRKAAGFDVHKETMDLLAKLFEASSITTGVSCPPLAEFLGIAENPMVVGASLPTPDPSVSSGVPTLEIPHLGLKGKGAKRKRLVETKDVAPPSQTT